MLKAVAKRLIVKRIEEETQDKKLIITVNENKPFKAVVIAAGSEVDSQLHEQEIVILPAHTGTPIEQDGIKYLVIYEDQILAVVDG
jgi:co-chaperonin GroES (HSP10)